MVSVKLIMKKILLFLVGATSLTIIILINYLNFNFNENLITYLESSVNFKNSSWLFYRLNQTKIYNNEITEENVLRKNGFLSWLNCKNQTSSTKLWRRRLVPKSREAYTIISNFMPALRQSTCTDLLITLTTHGDYRYLDNLVPLVERWLGPISIALYVPFDDLTPTLHRIAYIRYCSTSLIKEWVTFHLFSETRYLYHRRSKLVRLWHNWEAVDRDKLCSHIPGFDDSRASSRVYHKLLYPVNLARNIARQEARTKYIFPSDIELYPSVDLIPKFFRMLSRRHDYFLNRSTPYVFVVPVFEMAETYDLPDTKPELLELLVDKIAVPFHKYVCPECHTIPKYKEWLNTTSTQTSEYGDLDVFHVAKRESPLFQSWEPIYVSTNDVPLYDESLSWEGLRDKMPQSYIMCILNYDFMILDTAFLIHKPGIKRKQHNFKDPTAAISRQNRMLMRISNQIKKKYGTKVGCLGT